MEDLTGIDIFQYPFDREKGYSIIVEGKWEILVLKLEKLNENEKIIGKFIGVDHFKLQNDNEGMKKEYRYVYADVKKNLMVPAKVIERYYKNNPRMDYFYTEEEKKQFLKKFRIDTEG